MLFPPLQKINRKRTRTVCVTLNEEMPCLDSFTSHNRHRFGGFFHDGFTPPGLSTYASSPPVTFAMQPSRSISRAIADHQGGGASVCHCT